MLLAGEIGKPHGLEGEVYVVRISDDPHRFDPGAQLTHGDGRHLVVERSRSHRTRFLVKFEGYDDRTAAEGLRGALYVSADQLRQLGGDEFWPHELAGARVVTVAGDDVGELMRIDPGAAHDHFVVLTSAGERLVPAVKSIVVDVDVAARRITLDPPEGLLDP
jgi:16S rRNA processing protein RimM